MGNSKVITPKYYFSVLAMEVAHFIEVWDDFGI
mgnify:CR=1 FL=1